MKKTKKSYIFLGAVLLILGGAAIALLIVWFITEMQKLDPQPRTTILAALIGILGIVITQALAGSWNRRLEKERAQLNRRTEVYESIVRITISTLVSKGDPKALKEFTESMSKFGADLIVWGSEDVLKAWNDYRHRLMSGNLQGDQFFKLMADLLKAMRKDLGHKPGSLHDSDLLRPFINDVAAGINFPELPTQ